MWNMSRKRYSLRKILLQGMNATQSGEMMVQSCYQSNPTDGVTLIVLKKHPYRQQNLRHLTKNDFSRDISFKRRGKSPLHFMFVRNADQNGALR